MNANKHTPGPWGIEENEMLGRDIVADGLKAVICTQVYNPADASLIAAAPDMLEALEHAEKFVSSFELDQDYTDGQVETINAIRTAIAKATGVKP